ncbi:MAG: hypothetical protein WDZ40_03810 [Candidatus Spechtbacterales bacterium]
MNGMIKSRLSLVGFIALLNVGIIWLWQNWHPTRYVGADDSYFPGDPLFIEDIRSKLFAAVVVVVLLLIPAVALLFATFFVLNEKGQVPRGSWLYKIIQNYTPDKEIVTDSGWTVFIKDVPEEVRICPTYWKLVAFLSWWLPAILILVVAIPYLIYKGVTEGLFVEAEGPFLPQTAESWRSLLLTLGAVAFVGLPLLAFIITLIVKAWPRLRKTLIGRLVAAVYDKACVKLQIEPETN